MKLQNGNSTKNFSDNTDENYALKTKEDVPDTGRKMPKSHLEKDKRLGNNDKNVENDTIDDKIVTKIDVFVRAEPVSPIKTSKKLFNSSSVESRNCARN